jgi:hypothetical protein
MTAAADNAVLALLRRRVPEVLQRANKGIDIPHIQYAVYRTRMGAKRRGFIGAVLNELIEAGNARENVTPDGTRLYLWIAREKGRDAA